MDKRAILIGAPSPNLSSAIASNGLLFISGQTAGDVAGFEAQAKVVFEKLATILRAAEIDLSAVLRCGVYLSDIRFRDDMNRIYVGYFPEPRPARTTIECKMAEPTVLIEVDCVATLR